jgi:hypothetical protein
MPKAYRDSSQYSILPVFHTFIASIANPFNLRICYSAHLPISLYANQQIITFTVHSHIVWHVTMHFRLSDILNLKL